MEPKSQMQAWLECSDGEKKPIADSFVIGRSSECQVVIKDAKVSRRHCMINRQGPTEFWLVDLQSANGTRLNRRRINQAARLRHGDQIELAGYDFRFHQPDAAEAARQSATATMTIQEIRNRRCWLLVGDLIGSTGSLAQMDPEQAAGLTGRWLEQCRHTVESRRGAINKYLGDGFLAYWMDEPGIEAQVSAALTALKELQKTAEAPFRIVLHCGATVFGGAPSLGEESLAGREVNFTFRMEDLASKLDVPVLLSESAVQRLPALPKTAIDGAHRLQGFQGEFKFFGY